MSDTSPARLTTEELQATWAYLYRLVHKCAALPRWSLWRRYAINREVKRLLDILGQSL